MVKEGIRGKHEITVTKEMTAKAMESGQLPVYATPRLIALIEYTALKSVEGELEAGQSTVGTALNVQHLAPTPVGMTVTCETKLIEVDRRKLVFSAEVRDAKDVIGKGTHERFIVDNEKFVAKAEDKRKVN